MTRVLAAACLVTLLSGCVEASSSASVRGGSVQQPDAGRGPIDPRAVTRPATQTCGSALTSDGRRLRTPPVPLVQASRRGDRIVVEYKVLERPNGCVPDAILVTANSVDKLDNMGPGRANGLIRLTSSEGTAELKLPPLDLPPYEARASTLISTGARSDPTTVPVPESGDYCRRKASAAFCIRQAQAKFERCLRGEAPRGNCPDYVWRARPWIPYEPLQGVTRAGLERSFASMGRKTEHGGATFESVECSSTRECIVTWHGYGGIFRARFEISGYGQRQGCWIAERRAVLAEAPAPARMVPLRHLLADRQYACVHWTW